MNYMEKMHLTISVYKRQKQLFINIILAVYISLSSQTSTLVVIGTDCTGSYKPNYHTITTTTSHFLVIFVPNHVDILLELVYEKHFRNYFMHTTTNSIVILLMLSLFNKPHYQT